MRVLLGLCLVLSAACLRADDPPAQERPVRVLLVASAAGREFQFLRAALQREEAGKKFALTQVLLMADAKEPVVEHGPDKVLTKFPDKFAAEEKEDPKAAPFNLANYDAIVALDPDWTRLDEKQQGLLVRWIDKGGGLVVVAGEVHTPKLASPAHKDAVKTIRDLFPVVVADARLGLLDKPDNQPRKLTFDGNAGEVAWLRLGGEADLKGWDAYYGKDKEGVPERGFYRCYPVEKVKPGAVVLARVGKEMPFLVAHKIPGRGPIVYVGSDEFWRIRQARPAWHEELWYGLIRDAAATARK